MTKCAICNKVCNFGLRFVGHHVSYEPEILILLCAGCHTWLHAAGNVFKNFFKDAFKADISPYVFALKVIEVYHKAYKKYKEG